LSVKSFHLQALTPEFVKIFPASSEIKIGGTGNFLSVCRVTALDSESVDVADWGQAILFISLQDVILAKC
jgi:hypothetical protein